MESVSVQEQYELDDLRVGLEKVFEVSSYLNFPFTIEEVVKYFLPRSNISKERLHYLLSSGKFPDLTFEIRDDYLLTQSGQSKENRSERERMSADKLISAGNFASTLTKAVPFIRTVAVTGSVAYGSAAKWDDIDLFIVTQRRRLWISALLALVLVRLDKLLGLREPHLSLFCLSYVHDEHGFAKESNRNRSNPLFARELLKAKPVAGAERYRRILEENVWVSDFYSSSYSATLTGLKMRRERISTMGGHETSFLSFLADWTEGIAYVLLSNYLRMRAYLTNLRLKSEGNNFRVFEPVMSESSCVYTSKFYRWLSAIWSK
ncbi:MAG TPA: nucleotidyltransferase domain-containing protein [Candidatus Acidoferrales bacterium]|nr:nucleotidyltransferase domain-containing protein [Candidatus Acidoferrales bacterium]